ncbi:MAG: fluoride efflux transporter CrcB [Thermoleophilia bacterium]
MSGVVLWLGAGALGAAGAVARYAVDVAVSRRTGGELPWGTLAVNLVGSFALGVIVGLGTSHDPRFLAGGAFVGSFTTFSTWMLETLRLAEQGEGRRAAANVAVSLVLGIAAAGAGWALGAVL